MVENSQKISEFLKYLSAQKEAGLLIMEDEEKQTGIETILAQNNFKKSNSWPEMLQNLSQNQSTYIILSNVLPKELYDIIVQYSGRQGMIQIMDKEKMRLQTIQFDPLKAQLIILTSLANLKETEKKYQIKDKIGLTEIIN